MSIISADRFHSKQTTDKIKKMSAKKMNWKNSEIVKLLDMVRARPILWDPDHPKYRNSFQRDLVLDEVSYEMNTTNTVIKNKIQTMRCQYLREYRKLQTTKNYKPIWKYFDRMKFIYKHDKENFKSEIAADDSTNTLTNPNKLEISNTANDDSTNTLTNPTTLEISNTDNSLDDVYEIKEECITDGEDMQENKSFKRRLESKPENIISEQIKDDLSFFGEHIANELRLLNDYQDIQAELRSKIIFALKEAKLAVIKAEQFMYDY